jgi:hypothetical protein
MATQHKAVGQDEAIQDRRLEVWKLRVEGNSYRKIAKDLNCGLATVGRDVQQVLAERIEQTSKIADEYIALCLERFDAITKVYWQQMLKGDIEAARLIIQATNSIARLLNLYKDNGKVGKAAMSLLEQIIGMVTLRDGDPLNVLKMIYEELEALPLPQASLSEGEAIDLQSDDIEISRSDDN